MKARKRKIDRNLFDLVVAQKGKIKTGKLKDLVGISRSSICQMWQAGTWEGWLKMHEDYRLAKKAKKEPKPVIEQETLNLDDFHQERNFADLFELVDALREQLADLNQTTRELVDWEVRKQDQKEAYWARQKEKKSYFSRFGANDE